jgi:phosphoribosylglycinamide formyltransferase-1
LNIHPALLPSFKGAHAIKDTYEYGVKLTGVTVHFVDEEMDHGPIILQVPLRIKENDTLESIERKLHKIEHKIYPQAIKLWTEGKLKLSQRVVMLKDILS